MITMKRYSMRSGRGTTTVRVTAARRRTIGKGVATGHPLLPGHSTPKSAAAGASVAPDSSLLAAAPSNGDNGTVTPRKPSPKVRQDKPQPMISTSAVRPQPKWKFLAVGAKPRSKQRERSSHDPTSLSTDTLNPNRTSTNVDTGEHPETGALSPEGFLNKRWSRDRSRRPMSPMVMTGRTKAFPGGANRPPRLLKFPLQSNTFS